MTFKHVAESIKESEQKQFVSKDEKDIWNNFSTEINSLKEKINNIDLDKNIKDKIDKNIMNIDQNIRNINSLKDEIKDMKENGVFGGNSTGNNTAPSITSSFDKNIFTIDDEVIVPYFIVDGEGGKFKAYYTLNDVQEQPIVVGLGTNNWNIGKLKKGSYRLKIYVVDMGGLFSNQLVFNIQVGALELISSFNDKIDYKLNEEIIIGYTINCMNKKSVNMKLNIDGTESTKTVNVGFNNLNLGTLSKGVHKISIQAYYDNIYSNILTFNIVITDSNTLYLSTNFTDKGLTNADYISIPYRISLQGQKEFITHTMIDDVNKPLLNSILGINQFEVGYLTPGIHNVKIFVTTKDGTQTSNTLSIQLNIAQSDFKMAERIKDGLLLDLSAIGKSNAAADKEQWIDQSPYHKNVTLNGFNFKENGWIDNSLVINGKANVEIDIEPFKDNCINGLTIELYFEYKENSEEKCNFAQCLTNNDIGFYVNDEYTYLNSTIESIKYPLESDEFIHVAYVIDRNNKFEYIYINGCISAATMLYDSTDFTSNEKLKLGACIPNSLVDCAFKYVRVYNRALDHTEILTNFTSCKDIEEQKAIVKRNGENALPEMNISGNFDGMGKDLPVKLKIDYKSKGIIGTDFSLPSCPVEWQGDSTLQYAVKNYSIKLYQESGDKYKVQPISSWPKTHRVWTKANMMDSSSATSACIGHMFACLYKEKTPAMMDKKSSMYTVDSFPILMYHNDKFHGVYTWMLPPKANPLGLDKTKPYNYNFGCEENAGNGIGAFNLKDSIRDRLPTEQDILNGWSCYINSDGNAFNHFATLLKWVNDCYWSGTDNYTKFPSFREKAAKKFNLPFLIDYWIYCQVFGLVDSLGKNMQLYSFGTMNDEQEPVWYTTFFDFDTGLGCDNKGEFIWPPDMNCPEDYNTPHNLLWEMVRNEFKEEIKARYIELRRSNLNNKKFKEIFYDNFIHKIGEKYYNLDALNKYFIWGAGYIQMFHGNKWLELRKWFRERLVYLDTFYNYTGDLKHTIVLRNTHNGQIELNVKVESPQFVTTSFGGADGANDGNVVTKKCIENDYTTFRYSYNGSYQKDAYITSASQITDLTGLTNSDLIMLDIQYASKLINLNIDNNTKLTALHINNCTNLETFSAKNCTALTSVLDFNNSKNLKSIDIAGSGVQGIIYDKCLNLENLNIEGSDLKTFILNRNKNIKDINFAGCKNLNTIEISNLKLMYLDFYSLYGDLEKNILLENLTGLDELRISSTTNTIISYLNFRIINTDIETIDVDSKRVKSIYLYKCNNLNYISYNYVKDFNGTCIFDNVNLSKIDIQVSQEIKKSYINCITKEYTSVFEKTDIDNNIINSYNVNKENASFYNCYCKDSEIDLSSFKKIDFRNAYTKNGILNIKLNRNFYLSFQMLSNYNFERVNIDIPDDSHGTLYNFDYKVMNIASVGRNCNIEIIFSRNTLQLPDGTIDKEDYYTTKTLTTDANGKITMK